MGSVGDVATVIAVADLSSQSRVGLAGGRAGYRGKGVSLRFCESVSRS